MVTHWPRTFFISLIQCTQKGKRGHGTPSVKGMLQPLPSTPHKGSTVKSLFKQILHLQLDTLRTALQCTHHSALAKHKYLLFDPLAIGQLLPLFYSISYSDNCVHVALGSLKCQCENSLVSSTFNFKCSTLHLNLGLGSSWKRLLLDAIHRPSSGCENLGFVWLCSLPSKCVCLACQSVMLMITSR